MSRSQAVGRVPIGSFEAGSPGRPLLIAGPCVIEDEAGCLAIAGEAKAAAERHGFSFVFKASFDKANRTSVSSYRGPGLTRGLAILMAVRDRFGVPVLTDVHETSQVAPAAEVVDVLQIPAFLCRQTDLIVAAASTGRAVNIKKGQFLSPAEMGSALAKARSSGNGRIMLTERGTFFGYGRLVVDFAGMAVMRSLGSPVIFDATHSVQQPAALGDRSGGDRGAALVLARAAAAAGCDGLFLEVHPEPDRAGSDASTSLDFALLERALAETSAVFRAVAGTAEGDGS
jgi:2-dehydro-3-deoxyphosphooctonate aldolase (KDO 8-P synthase)